MRDRVDTTGPVRRLMHAYPRIYFACHTRHVRDPASDTVLSAHQASILSHLDSVDGTSLTELAAHMGVTVSTMSLSVTRLERQGYVRKSRSREDGRVVLLTLTSAGERVRSAHSVLDPSRVASLIETLTEDDRVAGLKGLEILAEAASGWMAARARRKESA